MSELSSSQNLPQHNEIVKPRLIDTYLSIGQNDKYRLLKQALCYAEAGLYVIPLHEPIFNDDGVCIGCTCEEYYRSEKCREKQPDRYDLNYTCQPNNRGKHPRIANWEKQATTDPKQIKKWWSRDWLFSNIGLAVGKSGLLMIDKDSYKDFFNGADFLTQEEADTVTTLSGSGGEHLYYRVTDEQKFGNARWTFPDGVDIRGVGGLAVLPGSIHPSGQYYQFEDGYSFFEREPAELSDRLFRLLTECNKARAAVTVTFSGEPLPKPDLAKWKISQKIIKLIKKGHDKAGQNGRRDEDDMKIVTALVEQKASDDEILAVYENYPIGTGPLSKFKEKGVEHLRPIIEKVRQRAEEKAIVTASLDGQGDEESDSSTGYAKAATYPYCVMDGKTVLLVERLDKETGEMEETEKIIFPYTAKIIEELRSDSGEIFYTVAGKSPARPNGFQFEIPATVFSDDKRLRAALESQAFTPVNVGMGGHVGNAIKTLSDSPRAIERLTTLGWRGDKFIIQGRVSEGVRLMRDPHLCYSVSPDADLHKGAEALSSLMASLNPEHAITILAAVLAPVLAGKVGWTEHRHVTAVIGQTGSLKTSKMKLFMSLYGEKFADSDKLIRWGTHGATINAYMRLASVAANLPIMYDNYKSNVAPGQDGLISIVQALIEGQDKLRLDADSTGKETNGFRCWPIFTGEDYPDKDVATMARSLIIRVPPMDVDDNLRNAQRLSSHLSALGNAWIDWLEKDPPILSEMQNRFGAVHSGWVAKLRSLHRDMKNANRIAGSLSVNQLTMEVAAHFPPLAPLVGKYLSHHPPYLVTLAGSAAVASAETGVGYRFLSALSQLLAGGSVYLQPGLIEKTVTSDDNIGRSDDDGMYLLPDLTMAKMSKMDDLSKVDRKTLYDDLKRLDVIAKLPKDGGTTYSRKIGGATTRVLHLKKNAFDILGHNDDEAINL